MNDLITLISRHGYLLLAAICFGEAIGLPLPAALALLTAGAVAAFGQLHFHFVFLIWTCIAMLCGDLVLYFTGRYQRMGIARPSLPPLGQSGDLHPALG